VVRSLTEVQKGWTFYLITFGLALLLALSGPTGTDAIQTINMFTATAGVLLMLLHLQRSPRSAGRRSGGSEPDDRRVPHRRDWCVHPHRTRHRGVGAG
jgi:hypothetical protein